MNDARSRTTETPDSAVLAATDCPDGIAGVASGVVDADEQRWERELLLAVFDACRDPPATRREALKAAKAVELLVGHRRPRNPFVADEASAPSPERKRRLLLAGDSLLALAFETIGTLSVGPPVVAECFEVTALAARESARERRGDVFDAIVAEFAAELGSVLGGARERRRKQHRRCGRAIGAAMASGGSRRDRPSREWEAVRRVVGSLEDTRLRTELAAFVDRHATD